MNYSYGELLDGTLMCQAVFTFCYLVSALAIFGNEYAGFVGLFTGIIFAGFTLITFYGIRQNISRTSFGMVLGASCMLVIISLQTAIFWGEYGNCEPYWSATPTSAPVSSPTDDYRRDDNRRSLEDINFASSYKTEMGQRRLIGVECYHVHAMKSVCAFAVFMFLTYLFMIGLLLRFKDEILGSAPLNEGYLGVPNVSTLLGQPDPEFGETPSQPDGPPAVAFDSADL